MYYIFSKDCKKYSNFINIGAGDGFYSCGLLYSERMQNCLAFEKSPQGRKSIKIWAQSNARLASLYKRKKQPEVAVPLLVEIIRLMTPNSLEGKEAYENLLQLGFVDTKYKSY